MTEQPSETPPVFLVETIARERQQWLDDLRKHYLDIVAAMNETEERLRALRDERDATARAIREMTPRKRRGTTQEAVNDGTTAR
jgi:ribosomal protein L13